MRASYGRQLCATLPAMNRKRLQREVEEAERELEAATKLSDVKAAAGRLQRARAALQELDEQPAERPERPTRGRGGAGAAS